MKTWRFHVDHCLWAWKYVVKLGREGRRVSAGIARANHTDHCVHEIMDRFGQGRGNCYWAYQWLSAMRDAEALQERTSVSL